MMLFYDPLATIGGWQTGSVIADNLWSKIAESQTLLMVNYRWKGGGGRRCSYCLDVNADDDEYDFSLNCDD